MASHVFCLIDSSIALRYSTATWSKQQFKPFYIWFTVFTCIMENSISCYWVSLFTHPIFEFLFRDHPNKICEEFIACKHKGVGGGSPLKKKLTWIYGTTNDLPGTNSGLPRNFILRCSKNLNTATKKDKQLHDSSEDYKDVFRFNSSTLLWGYQNLAGV